MSVIPATTAFMRGDYDAAHVSRLVRQTVRAVLRVAPWTRARTEADCWPHDCVQHVVRLNDSGARGGKVLLALYKLERAFLYFPERTVVASPADLGLVAEEITIQAADRVMLTGYWLAGRGERVLVWYYGNAGNLSHRLPLARVLLDCFGLDILLVDYRGYGRSQGQPTEDGLYADGLAMYACAVQRGFEPAQIVLLGQSLGAAVAIEVARRQAAGAVILETPFLSIPALAHELYPWLPPFMIRSRFDNGAKIGQVITPKLIVHGDRDEVVPMVHGHHLYDLAPEPKYFALVPGAGHNDLLTAGGELYLDAWRQFLAVTKPP